MAGTSIGAAIDYLVTGLPAVLTPTVATVIVADNEPDKDSDSLFIVGRQAPQIGVASNGDATHFTIGALRIKEHWTLDWWIQCRRDGPAQKPARDAVIALYDKFVLFLQADLTLGGALTDGGFAEISQVQLYQTQDSADTGTSGAQRLARISGEMSLINNYRPS